MTIQQTFCERWFPCCMTSCSDEKETEVSVIRLGTPATNSIPYYRRNNTDLKIQAVTATAATNAEEMRAAINNPKLPPPTPRESGAQTTRKHLHHASQEMVSVNEMFRNT